MTLQDFIDAARAAKLAGNQPLYEALVKEGDSLFGSGGPLFNPGEQVKGILQSLSSDFVKIGFIIVGLLLVLLALSSWLNMNQISVAGVGVPLPKLK